MLSSIRSGLRRASLRLRFSLYGGLLAGAVVVALTTLSYLNMRTQILAQERRDLGEASRDIVVSVEQAIAATHRELAALSRQSLLANALLDSTGRDAYLRPFLAEHRLSEELEYNLVLTDFRGHGLAARQALKSYEGLPWVRSVVEQGATYSAISIEGGRPILRLAFPVVYAYTGTREGALVFETDLRRWLDGRKYVVATDWPIRHIEFLAGGERVALPVDAASGHGHVTEFRRSLRPEGVTLDPALELRVAVDYAAFEAPLDDHLRRHIFLGLVAILLVGAASGALGRAQARRVEGLAIQARRAAGSGHAIRYLTGHFGGDEIGDLAASLAKLLDELNEHKRELESVVAQRTAELAAREADLLRAQRIAHIGSWRLDHTTGALACSVEIHRLLGTTAEQLASFEDYVGRVQADDREAVASICDRALDGETCEMEHRVIVGDHRLWVNLQAERIVDAEGIPIGCVGTIQDISERRLAEDSLRRLSAAVEQSSALIVITDISGAIQYVNPQFEQVTGFAAEEVRGRNPRLWKSNRSLPFEYAALWATIANGRVWRGEFENRRKDGSSYWALASISPIFDSAGTISGYVAVEEDITSRKEIERSTREREAKLSALIAAMPDTLVVVDNRGRIREFHVPEPNRLNERADHFLGRHYSDMLPPEVAGRFADLFAAIAADAKPRQLDYLIDREDGPHHFNASVSMVEDEAGAVDGFIVVARDVTARWRTEQALVASEARYRALFANSRVVMLVIDPVSGDIIDANHAAAEYYGYEATSLKAMSIMQINTLDRESIRAEMALASEEKRNHFNFRHRLASGEIRDVEVSSGPIEVDGRRLLLSAVQDVTERLRAERAVAESEAYNKALFARSHIPLVIMLPGSGAFIDCNAAAVAIYGFDDREAVIGRKPLDVSAELQYDGSPSSEAAQARIAEALAQGSAVFEWRHRRPNGDEWDAEVRLMTFDHQGETLIQFSLQDITGRRRTEARMREALLVFTASTQGIMTTDAAGIITSVNPAFCEITGYPAEAAIGKTPSLLKSGRHDPEFYQAMWARLAEAGTWEGEIWNRRRNGEIYPQWLTISTVCDSAGTIVEYVALFSDITKRKQQEEVIWRQANFDVLTGLANRALLSDRLDQALAQARRNGRKVGLLFLDLDGFKWINDTLGHDVGDELLVEVAQRLRRCVREQDTVARLGGDEFTLVVHDLSDIDSLKSVGQKTIDVLREPFTLAGAPHHLTGSVGITVFPDDGYDVQTLMRNADVAMYKSKQSGKNRFHFYDRGMQADAQERVQIEADLREAIERRGFVLHYQPIVDADSGELVGAEALIRWQHPMRGLVAPVEFIPVAEDCGLIVELGEWALREAARQWQVWHDAGRSLRLSVNISSVQFREAGLPDLVARVIDEFHIEHGCLMLEITESVLMDGSAAAEARMREIKAQGIGYSLDDFGTGFSSLSYLKRFPVDIVKIDRSFVRDCTDDRNDARLVEAIVNMAHSLDLAVTAEGVETEAQVDFLRDLGCDFLQGYLISRPVAAAEFEALMQRHPLLPRTDPASLEENRLLAALRQDGLDVEEWLRRLLGERSPEMARFLEESGWVSHGVDLRHAVEAHLAWRRRLNEYVGGHHVNEALDADEVRSCTRCELGRWIAGSADEGGAQLRELDRAHREFHRLAAQIVDDSQNGYRDSARKALSGLHFRKASRDVVAALINFFLVAAATVD